MPRRTSVTLHFAEQGEGVPVLAPHGWTPDHRLMLGCLEPVFATRTGYRRLYPDLPAMGKSPASPTIASSDDMLDAVQDFIDDTDGDAPFLLKGESYGGYLARAPAGNRPEQILALALICPIGTAVHTAERGLPERQIVRSDPELLASPDRRTADQFSELAVVQTPTTLHRTREEVIPGLARRFRRAAPPKALHRPQKMSGGEHPGVVGERLELQGVAGRVE
ncbi:pimeloyl-ACP methyl ester carboxylesterase [Streptomyces luteogriseus]|uniref:alpha/beta fold hydrolase n=1 Tax=Streptomyces luteogriseus TaxID=68233 RepID=UPI00278400C3|nr:alpha/beta hydrolase [Streptomyces luteogriseus]MDQ0718013.1 pimeloyl-ACP methyl ester carboxylesterase [Streptomyces luteogriseus]